MKLNNQHISFVQRIQIELRSKNKHNKTSIEKLAGQYGIKDKNEVKELTELAIVKECREITQNNSYSNEEKFELIVDLYNHQVNLSHRTSQSILLQQYSTPAPIGYLAGLFCGVDNENIKGFEPSAGNGSFSLQIPNCIASTGIECEQCALPDFCR